MVVRRIEESQLGNEDVVVLVNYYYTEIGRVSMRGTFTDDHAVIN